MRKVRQPNTRVSSRNAMPSGIPSASGIDSSSRPLFSITRQKAGSCSSWVYVDGPIHFAVIPSQSVIE